MPLPLWAYLSSTTLLTARIEKFLIKTVGKVKGKVVPVLN
jgi:hypothetical protein